MFLTSPLIDQAFTPITPVRTGRRGWPEGLLVKWRFNNNQEGIDYFACG